MLAFVFTCFSAPKVFGEFTEDLTVNDNVIFTFGDFDFGHTFTNEGLSIDIPNTTIGSISITPSAVFGLSSLSSVEVTARAEAGNQSNLLLTVNNSVSSDIFVYEFLQSDFTVGEFVTLSLDANDFSSVTLLETGVLNGDITGFGFAVEFPPNPSISPLQFTVQSVEFVTSVPEPMALPALLLVCGSLGIRRNRIS